MSSETGGPDHILVASVQPGRGSGLGFTCSGSPGKIGSRDVSPIWVEKILLAARRNDCRGTSSRRKVT